MLGPIVAAGPEQTVVAPLAEEPMEVAHTAVVAAV